MNGTNTILARSDDSKSKRTSFDKLSDEDKDTVKSLLYIMDTCCVGDAAYHENSIMVVDGLPRQKLPGETVS